MAEQTPHNHYGPTTCSPGCPWYGKAGAPHTTSRPPMTEQTPDLDVLGEIGAAVEDYRRVFREPLPLSPNLQLAVRAAAENERLRAALTYISAPTMGLPPGVDAAEFVTGAAPSSAVRLALQNCILQARAALAAGEKK